MVYIRFISSSIGKQQKWFWDSPLKWDLTRTSKMPLKPYWSHLLLCKFAVSFTFEQCTVLGDTSGFFVLAALGLCCHTQVSLLVVSRGFSLWRLLLLQRTGALQHVESFWTRNQTHVPCIGRWIPNHRTTKEVQAPQLSSWSNQGCSGLLSVHKLLISGPSLNNKFASKFKSTVSLTMLFSAAFWIVFSLSKTFSVKEEVQWFIFWSQLLVNLHFE